MSNNDTWTEIGFIAIEGISDTAGYGIGCVRRSPMLPGAPAVGERVLAPIPAAGKPIAQIEARHCLRISVDLPDERMIVVPSLAFALWVWDSVGLELGELATYTSGSSCERLVALVAEWRSGRDVLRLDIDDGAIPIPRGVRTIDASTPQRAIELVQGALHDTCGFASAVFSRHPQAIEILLEAMPVWSRIAVATSVTESATVDFYNNVHRKGARVVGVPSSPLAVFDSAQRPSIDRYLERATHIMCCEHLAGLCMAGED